MLSPDFYTYCQGKISSILLQKDATSTEKVQWTYLLFNEVVEEATEPFQINFVTLFSRMAFMGVQYQLPSRLLSMSHIYRKLNEKRTNAATDESLIQIGIYVIEQLLLEIYHVEGNSSLTLDTESENLINENKKRIVGYQKKIEAIVFGVDAEKFRLSFYHDDEPEKMCFAQFDISDKNEIFNSNIISLKKYFTLPIHVNFLDVEVDDVGDFIPKAMVIQPDFLIDVTSVAECFKDSGANAMIYLINKFRQDTVTKSLLVGNIANMILDELLSDIQLDFKSLLFKIFHSFPLEISIYDDQEIRDLIGDIKKHFTHLRKAIMIDFNNQGIESHTCFLEPSFLSRDFGIQGRLDVLHKDDKKRIYNIIELKSGSVFKPNVYKLNHNHYVQTLLYDLMIQSTNTGHFKINSYILYSKEKENPLRFAPPARFQQYQALKTRNDIISIEENLKDTKTDSKILQYINTDYLSTLSGFDKKKVETFSQIYQTLSPLETAYFHEMISFISREHFKSKVGEHGLDKDNGHASLWLETKEEKTDRFSILDHLYITENFSANKEAFMTFTSPTALPLSNLRNGDIVVLYPDLEKPSAILLNQVFKATIVSITDRNIKVKLRSSQYNQSLFESFEFWAMEQDSLDSSFNAMYRSLFSFIAADPDYRKLFLGVSMPKTKNHGMTFQSEEVTEEQRELLEKMSLAQDLFLLWGPPGTGKTSIMIKHYADAFIQQTSKNILVIAYTNRAVDEICDALLNIENCDFLRVGSRFSTQSRFHNHLLDERVKNYTLRSEIVELIQRTRIYTGTVASIMNKTELFMLKEFDTVIIDEASQILEPLLSGFLNKFSKVILIGDHRQLPAVVVQSPKQSAIVDSGLLAIGISNTNMSFFERIYLQYLQNEWSDALGILTQQGRMHEDIMAFPNHHFYKNQLKVLPGKSTLIGAFTFNPATDLQKKLLSGRTIFIPIKSSERVQAKVNQAEADVVSKIVGTWVDILHKNRVIIDSNTIGIITPFRAQVALIRQMLLENYPDIHQLITVDTVERYQGGARDIIIISFAVSKPSQMNQLVSMNHDGTDRKLNVALTRARKQIICVGDPDILRQKSVYQWLMDSYTIIDINDDSKRDSLGK